MEGGREGAGCGSPKGDPQVRVNLLVGPQPHREIPINTCFGDSILFFIETPCVLGVPGRWEAVCFILSKGPWTGFLSVLEMMLEVPLRLPWR